MSDIYGRLRENTNVPIERAERFMIEIKEHAYSPPSFYARDQQVCARCPFPKDHRVHGRT